MSDPGKKRKILVPVDFSDGSRAALVRAVELAPALGAEVFVLHAVDTSGLYGVGTTYMDVSQIAREMLEHARREVKSFAEAVDRDRRVIAWTEALEGRPAHAIVDCAKEHGADLIVMGTHGRTGLTRLVMGSVAEVVARTAPCDVLVVRGKK